MHQQRISFPTLTCTIVGNKAINIDDGEKQAKTILPAVLIPSAIWFSSSYSVCPLPDLIQNGSLPSPANPHLCQLLRQRVLGSFLVFDHAFGYLQNTESSYPPIQSRMQHFQNLSGLPPAALLEYHLHKTARSCGFISRWRCLSSPVCWLNRAPANIILLVPDVA